MQIVKKGQLSPWRDALVRKHCLTSSFGRIMKLKNGFLNKMKGASPVIAPTSKQKPFCHGEKWKWNLNITTGIVIRDCQPERNYR